MATPKNDSFRVNAQKSLDDKYLRLGRFPYVNVAEACSLVPIAERSTGLEVLVGDQVHCWAQGIQDKDLLPRNVFEKEFSGESTYVHKAGSMLLGFASKVKAGGSDIAAFKIGKTNGGSEVNGVPERLPASGNEWSTSMFTFLSDTDQTFFVTGITSPIRFRIFKL